MSIAPPAFVLVWAYAEGPFLLLSAAVLLALHRRWWWTAAALGCLATLTRPSGLLLALPAAVEGWRAWRASDLRARAGIVAAVVGPFAGFAAFLLWVEEATGDWLAPLRVQDDFRDGTVFPLLRLAEGLGEVVTDTLGDGLHVPFAFAMIALAWWACRHLPLSWSALAVADGRVEPVGGEPELDRALRLRLRAARGGLRRRRRRAVVAPDGGPLGPGDAGHGRPRLAGRACALGGRQRAGG